jgi:hypothetical protein
MTQKFSTQQIFQDWKSRKAIDAENDGFIRWLFQFGLQKMLLYQIGVHVAAAVHHKNVAPGLCAQFENSASRPVLGKLHQFYLWLLGRPGCPALAEHEASSREARRFQLDWMGRMIALRNQWQHPKDKTPEEIMEMARPVAADIDRVLAEHDDAALEAMDSGELISSSGSCRHRLDPFVFYTNGIVEVFSEYDPTTGSLLYSVPYPQSLDRFERIWPECRGLDMNLESPSLADLKQKSRALFAKRHYAGEPPAWLGDFLNRPEVGRLIGLGVLDGILAGLASIDKDILAFDLDLAEGVLPLESLAEAAGLALPLSLRQWEAMSSGGKSLLILGLRAGELNSRSFLRILYFLADVAESASKGSIRILIERDLDQLSSDQEKLWDRLPENLAALLRRPHGSKGHDLKDYLWSNALRAKSK